MLHQQQQQNELHNRRAHNFKVTRYSVAYFNEY